ncbi:MAG: hypothetical protein VKN72_04780 [Nostocales cyanobacterium 94392]|nr:hypothetical protein [Nostocales cyanobacterium 94392]
MTNKKFLKLVDFLQDNTSLAEYLPNSDAATKNNPEGEYATIERFLESELDEDAKEELNDIIK